MIMHAGIISLLSGPLLYIAQADISIEGLPSGFEKVGLIGLLMGAIWVVVKAYHSSNEARIAEIKAHAASLEARLDVVQKALLSSNNIDLSNTTRRTMTHSMPLETDTDG